MPKIIPENELDAIIKAVSSFPEGASIAQVNSKIAGAELAHRTLQRRLAHLVAQSRLLKEGKGPGTRYFLPGILAKINVTEKSEIVEDHAEVYIPISPEGESIKTSIRKPIHERKPVSYNSDLLQKYIPNETFYLSYEIRSHLYKLGHSLGDGSPAGTYARQVLDRILIDLSWNSSRLEGNTYSLLETERLLSAGQSVEGKNAEEAQMILNHKAAIELLVDQAEEIGFNSYTILNLHALLSQNLLQNPQACGRIRTIAVGIDGSVYHPLEVPQTIEECFQVILNKASMINDPFEQAFFTMVHLPYLQPFEDVNKRVSRLAANIPLIRENLSPLSFIDVPKQSYIDGLLGVYELNRTELLRDVFIWAYERSCAHYSAVRQSLGAPDPFRMKYRELIASTILIVVTRKMDKEASIALVKQQATSEVEHSDQDRFIEVAETELMSLHEGNIARYRLRPSEYQEWKSIWV